MDTTKFRVYLRALEPEDYLKTHKWRNDPVYQDGVVSVKRYVSLETEKKWVEHAIKEHESLKTVRFGVVLKETNEIIGLFFLKNIDFVSKQTKYGILIGENRGKGIAKEALILLLEYTFLELGLERISGGTLEDNFASIKTIESVGFVREGVLRNGAYKNGKFKNVLIHSMLREEFMSNYTVK